MNAANSLGLIGTFQLYANQRGNQLPDLVRPNYPRRLQARDNITLPGAAEM